MSHNSFNPNVEDQSRPSIFAGKTNAENQAVPISPDARRARAAEIDTEKGAPLSNTAPNNSNPSDGSEDSPYFQALRWGVDSLYVSYKGKLTLETEITLKRLKELAQSEAPSSNAVAQLKLSVGI